MNRLHLFGLIGLVAALPVAGILADSFVNLQSTTPGVPQNGHINVSGKVLSGALNATSASPGAVVLQGVSTSATGPSFGGVFKVASPNGTGIRGYASATSGGGIAGDFQSDGSAGRGLRALALAPTGDTIALVAQVNSPTGLAGKFVGPVTVAGGLSAATAKQDGVAFRGSATATSGDSFGGLFDNLTNGGAALKAISNGQIGTAGSFEAFLDGNALVARAHGAGAAGTFLGRVSVFGVLSAERVTGDGSGLTNVVPKGAAGGHLSGNYPNPEIRDDVVGKHQLAVDEGSLGKMTNGMMSVNAISSSARSLRAFDSLRVNPSGAVSGFNFNSDNNGNDFDVRDQGGTISLNFSDEWDKFGATKESTLIIAAAGAARRVTLRSNTTEARLSVSSGTGQSVFVQANDTQSLIQADVKNFRIPNPLNSQTDLVYACIEGPEAAAYLRGTGKLVDGRATIAFPDHFRSVISLSGMTVQLTPLSIETSGLACVSKSLDGFKVGELRGGKGNFEFDWEVKAVRRGYEDYKVVRPWDEGYDPAEREKLWAGRMKRLGAEKKP